MTVHRIEVDDPALSARERIERWNAMVVGDLAEADLAPTKDANPKEALLGRASVRTYDESTMAHIIAGQQFIRRGDAHIRRTGTSDALFNVVLSGSCRVAQDGRDTIIPAGGLFLYDAARPYEIWTSRGFETVAVMLDRRRLERILGNLRFYTAVAVPPVAPATLVAFDFWRTFLRQIDGVSDQIGNMLFDAGVETAIAALASSFDGQPRPTESCSLTIWRAEAFIGKSFHREDLTVADIAAAAGVSVRRLQECFKERDDTPTAALRRHRLRHARALFEAPNTAKVSVMSVMNSAGFTDPASFSRSFRREFGMSPSEAKHSILRV